MVELRTARVAAGVALATVGALAMVPGGGAPAEAHSPPGQQTEAPSAAHHHVAGPSAPDQQGADAGSDDVHPTDLFPPRANSAWVYDDTDVEGEWIPGRWADLINEYNQDALPANRISEVFTYGTDMETYCPEGKVENCTLDDLYSFYTPDSNGYASTGAYAQALDPVDTGDPGRAKEDVLLSPIIDGRTDAGGYLTNFNGLPEGLARGYADKVAGMVCADHRIDGIQFDLEPFDVTTKNGQYYFYMQLAKNFAGLHGGDPASDPYGCVDADHPKGRFFSFFTFPEAIEPGTQSASNVQDIVTTYGNGYMMASLYDLSTAPAGTLVDLETYTARVQESVANMVDWAGQLNVPYGFGIPASASAHEYTTCTGPDCVPTEDGTTGYSMIEYTSAAVEALHANDVSADRLYRGTAIWDLGASVEWNGNVFTPAPVPEDVLDYLGQNLVTPQQEESPGSWLPDWLREWLQDLFDQLGDLWPGPWGDGDWPGGWDRD